MQEVAVLVKNLDYRYSDHLSSSFSILYNITFTVNEGDILGIIGPNGAGKSTLFRCILGLLKDYRGEIAIFGHDIRKDRQVLHEIGYIPQQRLFIRLSQQQEFLSPPPAMEGDSSIYLSSISISSRFNIGVT